MEDIRNQMTQQIPTDGIYRKLGKVHNWLIETVSCGGNLKIDILFMERWQIIKQYVRDMLELLNI